MNSITVDELKKNKNSYIILDVREKFEREKDGFIKDSHHIPSSEIDEYVIIDFLKKFEDQGIVIYCNSGRRSSSLIEVLVINKIGKKEKLFNLNGGFQLWKGSQYEVEYPK